MTDKSAAVLPITPCSAVASQNGDSTPLRVAPADFGERLLRGRQETQRSLEEIADITKISIHQLRALERGDLHRLPAGIYRRAIVRQYAEAIGLNVEETLRDLPSVWTEVAVDFQRPEAVARPRGDAASSPFRTVLWSSAAALVVLGAAAAVATAWYRAGTTPVTADAPERVVSTPTPQANAPAIASVAATDAIRAATEPVRPAAERVRAAAEPVRATTEAVRVNAGNIKLATKPAVLQTAAGRVSAADAAEGELRITSEPAGALVTVNGIGWGPTPVTIRYMPFGKKVIRATKPGYVSAQRGFDFVPDRRVRSVRIQLSPESPEAR